MPVEMKSDIKKATKELPNSSSIPCMLACKNEPGCAESGISKDGKCYLFDKTVENQGNGGISVTVFKRKHIYMPGSKGSIYE